MRRQQESGVRQIRTLRSMRRGLETRFTVGLLRHSQRKRGATDRPDLRSKAPVLDPTLRIDPGRNMADDPILCRRAVMRPKRPHGHPQFPAVGGTFYTQHPSYIHRHFSLPAPSGTSPRSVCPLLIPLELLGNCYRLPPYQPAAQTNKSRAPSIVARCNETQPQMREKRLSRILHNYQNEQKMYSDQSILM